MTIREFKAKLIELINESKIGIDVIELVLKDLLINVHEQVDAVYARMAAEAEAEAQKSSGKKAKGEKANG